MNEITRLEIFKEKLIIEKHKNGKRCAYYINDKILSYYTKDYYKGTTKKIEFNLQDNNKTLKIWIKE